MNYLVKRNHYLKYINKFGNNRLDKDNKIWCQSKANVLSNSLNEIFDNDNGIETQYTSEIDDNGNYKCLFKSNSETEYRFDLLKDYGVESGGEIYYHLAFSLSEKSLDDITYEMPTNFNETIEVLNRLIFILKDLNINSEFSIGASDDNRKNSIYRYILKNVQNWEKRDNPKCNSNWSIFFTI